MARKGKKKKSRKKAKNYSKKKFKNIICSTCKMCPFDGKAEFCYSSIYRANPEIFISQVYPNLVDISRWRKHYGHSSTDLSIQNFSFAFCQTGVCTKGESKMANSCPSYSKCFDSFKKQMAGEKIENSPIFSVYKKKKTKKKKPRKVYDSYPTFFSRSGEKFERSIRKILYGDTDIEQDKDKESASTDQGSTDGNLEGGKSKISGSSK